MTTLSGSSAVESTAILTTTNTAYGKTKLKGVGIEYEMVDEPRPAQPIWCSFHHVEENSDSFYTLFL